MVMSATDEDLNQLEKEIRQLKIEYEQYFGGGRSRPPTDTQWRAEQMIKRYSDRGADMSFAQRFRYNNLAQTYAKYMDIWRKRLKQKEEGFVPRHFGAAAKAIAAEREKVQAAQQEWEVVVACSDPDRETDKVAKLYRALVDAKQKAGEETAGLNLEGFSAFLRQKTQQLKQQKHCDQVEYLVRIEGGHARLKARVKE